MSTPSATRPSSPPRSTRPGPTCAHLDALAAALGRLGALDELRGWMADPTRLYRPGRPRALAALTRPSGDRYTTPEVLDALRALAAPPARCSLRPRRTRDERVDRHERA